MLVLSFLLLALNLKFSVTAQATGSIPFQPYTVTTKSRSKQALTAQITSRPVLELRDVNSICGYWSSVGITYTVGCNSNIPCMFSSIAPGSVFGFCAFSNAPVLTKGYDYGAYPAGGCQPGQLCCNSAQPSYGEFVFDNGASTFFQCSTSRFDIAAATAIATPISTTTSSSTRSSSTSTTASSTSTSNSPSTSSFAPGSSSSTSSSSPASTTGATANSDDTPSNTTGTSASSSKLSTGAIVGIAIGALAAIVLIALAIFCCLRRRKRSTSHDTYLQMYPATAAAGAGIHKSATHFHDNPSPPTYHDAGFAEKQYAGHGMQGVGGSHPEARYWDNGPTAYTHMLREG